ncbi:MAG: DUF4345 family protein [Planctomycetota bacterium]
MPHFPTVTLVVTSATFASFALWLGSIPDALLAAFGIETSTPGMRTEIRAFYGGLELAIAVAMLVLWRRGETAAALIAGGLPLIGSAAGRLVGCGLDGFSALHAGFAVLELFGGGLCLIATRYITPASGRRQPSG